jgi:hypothetical protein
MNLDGGLGPVGVIVRASAVEVMDKEIVPSLYVIYAGKFLFVSMSRVCLFR